MGDEVPVSCIEGGSVLKGEVAHRARELIRQTCLSLDVRIERGHIGKDHVHMLASSPPKLSPSEGAIRW